jgi:hypothetical protein
MIQVSAATRMISPNRMVKAVGKRNDFRSAVFDASFTALSVSGGIFMANRGRSNYKRMAV